MRALVITLGLLMLSTAAIAKYHGGKNSDGRAGFRAHMQQELGLSDEQIQQMQEIRGSGGSRKEMRAVLTEEQQAQMKEIRERHKGKRLERMARMKEHLDLSDDQVAQMQEIRERGGNREEMHAVLTEEQQAQVAQRHKNHGKHQSSPEE